MKKEDFYWLNPDSLQVLGRGYLPEGVEAKERIRQITDTAEDILKMPGFSDKLYSYMAKGWISLSSPVWANFGLERGLPISCFGQYIEDDTVSILKNATEGGVMSKVGGGTSNYVGELRPRGSAISAGGKSNGAVSFLEIFEAITNTISQNGIRRGSLASYIPISHGDIEEFLTIRNDNSPIQNLNLGVTVEDTWMKEMIAGDIEKMSIWGKVLKKRSETGFPYLFFTDTVNNNKPQVYKDKNCKIHASNLCTEIMLPASEDESFVCCLSSLNLYHYDEWKDTDLVETMLLFLDAVLSEFIEKASEIEFMEKAVKFAKRHRAVGLGVLGLHSLLQSEMLSFGELRSKMLLNQIFSNIKEKADAASKKYAKILGEPEILEGYGERWATKLAIAPTTSSSFILGQISPSIEPLMANYMIKDIAKGKYSWRNPELEQLLEDKGKNTEQVWKIIREAGGSVQGLKFLTQKEKEVFKTFGEISQMEVVQNAAIIQSYVDQGISLNLFIHPDVKVKDINKLVITAWELGLKTLYYQRGVNLAQKVGRDILSCTSCEG